MLIHLTSYIPTAHDNLFADAATRIQDFENFLDKIHRDCFGEAFQGIPSDYLFHILSRATLRNTFVTLVFSNVYLINELKFVAYSDTWGEDRRYEEVKEPYSFKVEVSKDELTWTTVTDHSMCKCYFIQQLYFPKQAAR